MVINIETILVPLEKLILLILLLLHVQTSLIAFRMNQILELKILWMHPALTVLQAKV